ncbi:SMC-Scp complex subunit ScpB [Paludicola sp. MB14-C6]|uniref:SMC-Scp complex subunit ScpB n=1 Tax=Paludihabitans sp. MB14-C6 TaxID=3070656 RepID=UPI0027DC3183|nr:SMC-Scp complex subunit ScpB [Paludicola sp. MB14-C6]WMJ22236.1 SMC-Scp complex subunit ScpB [Paludicola sp. MB14-C6]
MEINKIKGAIEAILFASGEPVEVVKIAQAIDVEEDIVYKLLRTMQDKYDDDDSGIMLCEMVDSFQLCTKPIHADKIKKALEMKRNIPLSQAAMEILAIIAYNQPVTKGFIEQIRGVDSSSTVNSLVEKGLVEEAGRLDVPGKPIAYQTTVNFLRNFDLKSLEELPPLPDESGQVMLDEVVNSNSAYLENEE